MTIELDETRKGVTPEQLELLGAFNAALYAPPFVGKVAVHIINTFILPNPPEHTWELSRLVKYHNPQPTVDDGGKLLRYYATPQDAEKSRWTVAKPARALGKILGGLITEKDKESFATWWAETITLDVEGLQIKTCDQPETFAQVYTMPQAKGSDPRLGFDRKSLACSCMRYGFDHLPHHPAYVYGSGDFEIVWVENRKGELLGRYVASIKGGRYVRGPIYTNTDFAADMLQKHAESRFDACEDKEKATWVGSRLLRIETRGEGFLAPYLDREAHGYDSGTHLVISGKNRELDLSSTSGTTSCHEYHCEGCGCGLYEDEGCYAQDGVWCQECFDNLFVYCDSCGEYESESYTYEVRGHRHIHVCEGCLNRSSNYVTTDDSTTDESTCHVDDVIITEDSGECYHGDDEGVFFFISDVDGLPYSLAGRARFPQFASDIAMTWEQAVESGHWETAKDEEGNPILRLRVWLEFEDGEVVNRQTDLFETV